MYTMIMTVAGEKSVDTFHVDEMAAGCVFLALRLNFTLVYLPKHAQKVLLHAHPCEHNKMICQVRINAACVAD